MVEGIRWYRFHTAVFEPLNGGNYLNHEIVSFMPVVLRVFVMGSDCFLKQH